MGRVKAMWMDMQDAACAELASGHINEEQFKQRMRKLNISEEEIEDYIYYIREQNFS